MSEVKIGDEVVIRNSTSVFDGRTGMVVGLNGAGLRHVKLGEREVAFSHGTESRREGPASG
jgi:hypothetical protein